MSLSVPHCTPYLSDAHWPAFATIDWAVSIGAKFITPIGGSHEFHRSALISNSLNLERYSIAGPRARTIRGSTIAACASEATMIRKDCGPGSRSRAGPSKMACRHGGEVRRGLQARVDRTVYCCHQGLLSADVKQLIGD